MNNKAEKPVFQRSNNLGLTYKVITIEDKVDVLHRLLTHRKTLKEVSEDCNIKYSSVQNIMNNYSKKQGMVHAWLEKYLSLPMDNSAPFASALNLSSMDQ